MSVNHIYSLGEFFCQVAEKKCWTAWRTERRTNKTTGQVKVTTVPYSRATVESKSNDPTTWVSIEEAKAVAETEGFINGRGGGIGIFLGIEYGPEYRLGGVDLDTCLSPENGLTPWAQEIIDRFRTYSETSPSQTGVKLYFLYRVADLDAIRRITGTDWSRNLKERTGSDHAPGIELHLGHRYFAMTGDLYEGCPEVLQVIEPDDIEWLLNEIGQRFQTHPEPKTGVQGAITSQKRDNSRSGAAASRLLSLWVNGWAHTYEKARERLLNDPDPDVVAWMTEKGLERRGRKDEYEFHRLWDWVTEKPKTHPTAIMEEAMRTFAEEAAQEETPQQEETSEHWPEPMDIFGALTHEPILTADMLPRKIRDFVYDESELLGCDPGAMAVTALAVCSSLISDAITIQPKRFDTTYRESARLWLMLTGLISNKKTPMLKKLTDHIRAKQAEMKRKYDFEKEEYRKLLAVYEAKRKAWVARTAGGYDDAEEPEKPEKPRERRLLTSDYTTERLAEILCENPRGILILMDEIMALFGGFDASKAGKVNKDRPVTLEGYNGGPKDIDRVGSKDDRIHVPNWSFCIVGGIQHSKLDLIGEKLGDDGLLQRFLMMPMEPPKIGIDRPPRLTAITEYTCLIENLIGYDPLNPNPIVLSEGAHSYREQIDELVSAFESFPGLSEPFQAYAGKFGGTFARLLLTMHVIENCPGWGFNEGLEERERLKVVGVETARRTFDLMTKFLIPHAIRQYERLDSKRKSQ